MMMLREGRAGLLVLSVSALSLLGASAPTLNPTVKVLEIASSPVPSECEEGLAATAAPRIEISEPSTAMAPAPPSTSLRGQLNEAQTAAEHHDRAAFADALARVKTTLQPYPPGGERNVSTDVVHVYDDLNRLWTYEFENPNGAFFDGTNSLLAMLNGYPGYQKAIADQMLTVQGTTLYPSRESRDFLVREAAARMGRLTGERAPAAPAVVTPMLKKHQPKVEDKSKPLPKIVKRGVAHRPKKKAAKVAATPTPTPTPAPVPLPPSVVTTTTAPPPPAPAPATTTTAAPPPTTTTTAPATTTTAAETTSSAEPAPEPKSAPSPMRSIILPIILILVGIGVLVVLFRASS